MNSWISCPPPICPLSAPFPSGACIFSACQSTALLSVCLLSVNPPPVCLSTACQPPSCLSVYCLSIALLSVSLLSVNRPPIYLSTVLSFCLATLCLSSNSVRVPDFMLSASSMSSFSNSLSEGFYINRPPVYLPDRLPPSLSLLRTPWSSVYLKTKNLQHKVFLFITFLFEYSRISRRPWNFAEKCKCCWIL